MKITHVLQRNSSCSRGDAYRAVLKGVGIRFQSNERNIHIAYCSNKVLSRQYSSSSPLDAPPLHVFASCLPGLEPFLNEELVSLGFQTRRTTGGVHFRASNAKELHSCHLWCGTASNIYLRATEDKTFRARGMAELKKHITRLSFWEECIDTTDQSLSSGFEIRVKSSKSKLYHTAGIAQRVEEGIYSALGKDTPSKEITESQNDSQKLKVLVKIYRDEVEVSVDTSSTPIHQRGYRLETAKAPLREDLAFALLYSTKLFGRNNSANDWSVLDPFCGAGTIPIEAAALAHNLPPGRLREAPLRGLTFYDPDGWNRMVESAVRNSTTGDMNEELQILGTDRNEGAIAISERNAARASVDHLVKFRHQAISSNQWFENPSLAPSRTLVVCNPPFGHRISKDTKKKKDPFSSSLLPLIQTLGHKLMKLIGQSAEGNSRRQVAVNILGTNPNLIRRSGIPNLKVSFASKHGGINVFALGQASSVT
ncbi:unnamed protein product [Cylindrotheca closterium]|uniref:Uncharacterized protein n=1 Tax=Cylindrotheca closterium TaxID=2856 RepID=A0AAD2CJP1_9STRA|nr:unnamed protein product [Cylindrotheca closterium]